MRAKSILQNFGCSFVPLYFYKERSKEKKVPGRKDEAKQKKKLTTIDGQVRICLSKESCPRAIRGDNS